MTNGLFYAHSGLRYLVLLVGLVAAAAFFLAWRSGRPMKKSDRVLMASFTGLLDLQFLLGVAMVAVGIFYSALIGHMVMMLGAVLVAHGSAVLARGQADPRRGHAVRMAGILVALLLIAGGIAAIGRGIFQSGAPSM